MATILFYVSDTLQTRIGSWGPIVDLQDADTASYPSPVNDKGGTGEGGGGKMTTLHQPQHLKVS